MKPRRQPFGAPPLPAAGHHRYAAPQSHQAFLHDGGRDGSFDVAKPLPAWQGSRLELDPVPLGRRYSWDPEAEILKRSKCCCCGPLAWQLGCCAGLLLCLAVLVAYSVLQAGCSFEVHGTEFDLWNYCLPQLQLYLAGLEGPAALARFYRALVDRKQGGPDVGLGPGPNTRSYYGHAEVKRRMQDMVLEIREGRAERANEWGLQMLRSDMWPETGSSLFGLSNGDHATVRPYLAEILDGAERPDEECDGATCWNSAWLRRLCRQRLRSRTSLSYGALEELAAALLHKVYLNADLSESQARRFVDFQGSLLRVMSFPKNDVWEAVLGRFPSELKKRYVETYQAAVASRWPKEDWSMEPSKLTLLGNAFLDSIAHAGPALAGALARLLSLLVGSDGRLPRRLDPGDGAYARDLVWESLRLYPPVEAVPYWLEGESKSGVAWRHEILSLRMALQDASTFEEPLSFRPGRPGLNHGNESLSVGFADSADADGDAAAGNSHSCLGKRLSLAFLQAFIQEFSAERWEHVGGGAGPGSLLLRKLA